MKDYTSSEPVFSSSITVVETTDPAHADNINAAPKQLLQNTLVLNHTLGTLLNELSVKDSFYKVFSNVETENESSSADPTAMSPAEVNDAITVPWDGQSSTDPTAMSSSEVSDAITTPWDGQSSTDSTALQADEISSVLKTTD